MMVTSRGIIIRQAVKAFLLNRGQQVRVQRLDEECDLGCGLIPQCR